MGAEGFEGDGHEGVVLRYFQRPFPHEGWVRRGKVSPGIGKKLRFGSSAGGKLHLGSFCKSPAAGVIGDPASPTGYAVASWELVINTIANESPAKCGSVSPMNPWLGRLKKNHSPRSAETRRKHSSWIGWRARKRLNE